MDLEGVGGNRLDGPAVAERRAQLVRADAARAPGPWLAIAEAHQVASAGWSQHSREAGDVPGPVVVAEYVEHPAIDHGVGSEAEAAEVECVCDFEPRGQPALGRFRARPRDRGPGNVEVQYDGDPKFEPIEGTGMQYAVNTASAVLLIDGNYWLCEQAVWYVAGTAQGP